MREPTVAVRPPEQSTSDERRRDRRRWFFWGWVALTIVAAAYIGIAAPVVESFRTVPPLVGVIFPPLMILLLGIGLGWLALYVSRPGPPTDRA